jgi:hypothetical protein
MKRKERTSEEKQIDVLLKSGIMRLGPTAPAAEAPTPYPYFLAWDKQGRKGQRCTIIRQTTRTCQVRFEDGHLSVFNRQAIRRVE